MGQVLRQRLELRQSQQLAMTVQLRQAIAMLQMSNIELSSFLAEQIEANPMLSLSDGLGSSAAPMQEAVVEPIDTAVGRSDLAAGEAQFVTGRENLYESGDAFPTVGARSAGLDAFDDDRSLAMVHEPSLTAHVDSQLALMRLDPLVLRCAQIMAGELDESGYLRVADGDLAARLAVGQDVIVAARAAIHACEPTGIGARHLAECLALQLAERNRLDPAMQALLHSLPDLPSTPSLVMARRCGVDQADFAEMLAELRALDPRPGLQYADGTAALVVPDVLVQADGMGWRVALNPAVLPRLLVDETYAARVSAVRGRDTRTFLAACSQNARWLRKSLDQRARTILAVATEIARVQGGFFDHGVSALRPLKLKTVAEAIGVHESTVSRVTSNKFMATPRGVFELKFFFTGGIAVEGGGETVAAPVIRDRIRALVAAESPAKPLSDDQLVRQLKAEGIDVARRTVAKYREALHIASSVERRRRAGAAV